MMYSDQPQWGPLRYHAMASVPQNTPNVARGTSQTAQPGITGTNYFDMAGRPNLREAGYWGNTNAGMVGLADMYNARGTSPGNTALPLSNALATPAPVFQPQSARAAPLSYQLYSRQLGRKPFPSTFIPPATSKPISYLPRQRINSPLGRSIWMEQLKILFPWLGQPAYTLEDALNQPQRMNQW